MSTAEDFTKFRCDISRTFKKSCMITWEQKLRNSKKIRAKIIPGMCGDVNNFQESYQTHANVIKEEDGIIVAEKIAY